MEERCRSYEGNNVCESCSSIANQSKTFMDQLKWVNSLMIINQPTNLIIVIVNYNIMKEFIDCLWKK